MPKPNRLCLRAVEFRAADEPGDGRTLEGYAAVFDSPTRISSWEGEFDETISSGAFSKTLGERMPVLQFDHGRDARTGSVPIGKIEDIREDSDGLFVRARMYDNSVVEPIRQAIEGGSIDGMSFRFKVVKDEWHDNQGRSISDSELGDMLWRAGDRGPIKRTIREVELFEAGPVVFPAYESTSVGVRAMLGNLDDDERSELVQDLAFEIRAYSADDSKDKKKCKTCGQTLPDKKPAEKKSTPANGAVRTDTTDAESEADLEVTSGTEGERVAQLREFDLKEMK